jgi:hypothetical protein
MSEFPNKDAMMALGVFIALCQIAATGRKDERGTFKKSNGEQMSMKQIAMLIRCQESVLSKAVEILADQRVAWVICHSSADDLPLICHSSATSIPKNSENSSIVQGEGEGEGEGEGAKALVSDETKTILLDLWDNSPKKSRERSSKKQVADAWKRIKSKPSQETIVRAITAWCKCEDWVNGYAQGLHIWIKDERWVDLPEATHINGDRPETGDFFYGGRTGKVTRAEDLPVPEHLEL